MNQQDVIVIGGGMVGAAVALGLAKAGVNVALIEKQQLPPFSTDDPYDVRISAISVASVALLEQLGVWQQIAQQRVCPYDGLETWEIDGFNTAFHAKDIGLDKLGFMVENNLIQRSLWQQLNAYPNCTQALGFSRISANYQQDIWTVRVDERDFQAPLIIACDGANSLARQWAGIGLTGWQYRQHCLLATVQTELPQQSVTWQQFFPSGPRAFLPLSGHHGCIVWYDSPQRILQLKQLSAEKLTAEIQHHFPSRLGQVSVVSHAAFPLARQHAQRYVHRGVVLVGDAAHTINPLAGQGVNLGFKDVKVLLELFQQALEKGKNFADPNILSQYERKRKPDNLLMQTGMDVFYKAFKTDLLPVKIARNLALIAAERATPIKNQALKYAIGL